MARDYTAPETLTPQEFIRTWKAAALTERQAAQSHFTDLCRLVGHKRPVDADPTGEDYAFEKGASKSGGGEGFADVWKRGAFAWVNRSSIRTASCRETSVRPRSSRRAR